MKRFKVALAVTSLFSAAASAGGCRPSQPSAAESSSPPTRQVTAPLSHGLGGDPFATDPESHLPFFRPEGSQAANGAPERVRPPKIPALPQLPPLPDLPSLDEQGRPKLPEAAKLPPLPPRPSLPEDMLPPIDESGHADSGNADPRTNSAARADE